MASCLALGDRPRRTEAVGIGMRTMKFTKFTEDMVEASF